MIWFAFWSLCGTSESKQLVELEEHCKEVKVVSVTLKVKQNHLLAYVDELKCQLIPSRNPPNCVKIFFNIRYLTCSWLHLININKLKDFSSIKDPYEVEGPKSLY